jgi:predicted nucleic acid-binding protein
MNGDRFVLDASVLIKWVVSETLSSHAIALIQRARIVAPDLILAECANILWKKVQRREIDAQEALVAARILEQADIEFVSLRSLTESATRIALDINHAAYDCAYLALALHKKCPFVTADQRLVAKLRRTNAELASSVRSLSDMADLP